MNLVYEIDEGGCVGRCEIEPALEVDEETMSERLYEFGSMPELRPEPNTGWIVTPPTYGVAIAVAMGIRTFFLQPFKIPTGSMQPTLYGITHESFRGRDDVKFPTGFTEFVDSWFRGVSYFHVVCEEDGELREVEPPKTVVPLLVKKQRFQVGNRSYTVWFPPDQLFGGNAHRSGLYPGQRFKKGDDIIKLKVI